jgi:transcriptional/translational regulatory protein YebC/TACO1
MIAVDAGAEDVITDEGVFEVITEPADFARVRKALEDASVEMESAELVYRPSSVVPIDEGQAGTLMRLIDALEDSDDVSAVHANFDVAADVLERVAG